jgi:hypothetical protein
MCFSAPPPPLINDSPQPLKQLRHAVNLVQDDQLAFVLRKVPGRVGELGALILVLKIEVYRGLLVAYLQS